MEGRLQDLPLHRVGVLELVDQHHREAVPQPRARGRPVRRVAEHVAQQGEQVVVVAQPLRPLARVELDHAGAGQAHELVGQAARLGVGRFQPRVPVTVGGRDDLVRPLHRHRGASRVGASIGPQVQVVDDLATQVGGRFDQLSTRIEVSRHAETVEDLGAEAVRGGDGGGVEVRHCPGQPAEPQRDLLGSPGGQVLHKRVVGHVVLARVGARTTGCHLLQPAQRGRQPFADPLAQLLGRRDAERREQQLRELDALLGDVPGGQGRDGPGLAGAGAGLQHHRAGGQRPVRIEAHRICSASSSGAHSRRASSENRVVSRAAVELGRGSVDESAGAGPSRHRSPSSTPSGPRPARSRGWPRRGAGRRRPRWPRWRRAAVPACPRRRPPRGRPGPARRGVGTGQHRGGDRSTLADRDGPVDRRRPSNLTQAASRCLGPSRE